MKVLEEAFIHVEADISNGLPVFHMVGYLSSEVKRRGESVRTAIKNSGFEYPGKADGCKFIAGHGAKAWASFDLPIAAAILTALGRLNSRRKTVSLSENSALGKCEESIRSFADGNGSRGKRGERRCIIPEENAGEGRLVSEMEIIGVSCDVEGSG